MNLCFLFLICLVGVRAQFLLHHDSCKGRCFTKNDYAHKCQCDYDCEAIGNCCGDFWVDCRGSETGLVVTQKELHTFAQSIWDNDVNRIDSALYTLNYQGQTTAQDTVDQASAKLITPTDDQLDAILASRNSTYKTFINLLDNYDANVQHQEHRPQHEIQEESHFLSQVMQTQVMQLTFNFLVDNGFIRKDIHAFRTVLNEIWFELYPKVNSNIVSDSGFEHIMVGEKPKHGHNKTATISGLNNWVQFYQEEKAGHIDYNGYIRHTDDPIIVDARFTWKNAMDHSASFFMGTSPEFDMSLFTVCALAFPNKQCSFSINGQHINIDSNIKHHQQIKQLGSIKIRAHVPTGPTPTNSS